jgi:hypothetical protein
LGGNKNRAGYENLPCFFIGRLLDDHYILRLQAFLALDDGEFYALALIEVAVAITKDGVVMDE